MDVRAKAVLLFEHSDGRFARDGRKSATLPLAEMQGAILDGVAAWSHGPLADDVSLVIVEVR